MGGDDDLDEDDVLITFMWSRSNWSSRIDDGFLIITFKVIIINNKKFDLFIYFSRIGNN